MRYRHRLPIRSVVVLLRREADAAQITGIYDDAKETISGGTGDAATDSVLRFRYAVVRLWEVPAAALLSAGLGTLALAPLARVESMDLPEVIRRMKERIAVEAAPAEAATLWASTYILLGLRYSRELAGELLKGVREMRESTTYQAILEEGEEKGRVEGRAEGARETLLRIGTRRFGPASAPVVDRLTAIQSAERLEELAVRVLESENWDELLRPDA